MTTPYAQCGNCQAIWREDDLDPALDLHLRVDPGEEMPAGECPACGALAHLLKLGPPVTQSPSVEELRCAVADLLGSAGCGCCQDDYRWNEARARLGELLQVPKGDYNPARGEPYYDFGPFVSK